MPVNLDDSQCHLVLLALAKLSLERPGWHPVAISAIVAEFPHGAVEVYESFRKINDDTLPMSSVAETCAKIVEVQADYCAKMMDRNRGNDMTKEQAAKFVQAALKGAASEIRKYAADLDKPENMGASRKEQSNESTT